MKLRITQLTQAVLTRQLPDVLGAAVVYHLQSNDVTTACHVQVDGVFMSFWKGDVLLSSHAVYVGSMIDRPDVSSFGHREAAAYSALAHVIGAQLVVVDTPLFHALLKLTQRVAAYTGTDTAEEEVAGYWRTYEKECGLTHNERIELDDADESSITDSTLALNTLRDMFYEYMAFDFTSPSESGYWARVWGYDEWQKLKEVDAVWEFAKLDNDAIVPTAFLTKFVANRPRRPHCVVSSDTVFDVIPEIEDDELRLWLAEPRVFNNVPDNIVADCENNTFDDSDIQLSVDYKDGGPDSSTSRVTYTLEEQIF
jgi:hypothetical protein